MDNARRDFVDLIDGYKAIGSLVMEQGPGALVDVAEQLPGALVQSYTRWFEAGRQGRLLEMMHAHPVEFVQDWTLPLTVVLSVGGTAVPKIFGTGATAGRAAAAMNRMAVVADSLQTLSDPIGGTAAIALKRAVGAALRANLNRPTIEPPRQKMPIDLGDQAVVQAPLTERVRKTFDRMETAIVDDTYPIRQLGRRAESSRIEASTGRQVSAGQLADNSLEQRVRTYSGFERKVLQVLEPSDRTPFKGFTEPDDFTRPLERDTGAIRELLPERVGYKQIFDDLGAVNLADFRDYAVARRVALDLTPQGKPTGANPDTARAIVDEFDPSTNPKANPDIHNAWVRFQQFKRDRLTYYQRAGLISRRQAAEWTGANPNHVTFQRTDRMRVDLTPEQKAALGTTEDSVIVEMRGDQARLTGAGGSRIRAPKQIIKRFTGSLRMIQDPIQAEALLTARMMREAELNQVFQEAAKLADIPDSGVRLVDAPEGVSRTATLDELNRTLEMEGVLEQVAQGENAVFTSNSALFRPKGLPDNVHAFYVDGERRFIQFDDPDIAQAFGNLRFRKDSDIDRWFSGKVVDLGRGVAALQRAGVTLEPGFTLGLNVFRDAWQAYSFSRYGFKPVYDNLRGAFHYLRRSEVFDLWARSGGMQAHLSALDRPILRRSLEQYLAPENRTYLRRIAPLIRSGVDVLQRLQEFSEASTRLGEFNRGVRKELGARPGETARQAMERARAQGVDVQGGLRRASVSSRDVTVDFTLRGADPLIRNLNAVTAFQNANIQGLDLLRRKFFNGTPKERAAVAAKTALGITLPSVFFWARNQHDPEYRDIPDVEKDLFLHIRLPEGVPEIGGQLVRIPRPFDLGLIFGALPERALESIAEGDPAIVQRLMMKQLDPLRSNFQPFGLPTLLKAPLEVLMNHNLFFDAPLESRGQQRFIKSERAFASTSELARVLSKWSEYMAEPFPSKAGGVPKEAILSPVQIDHLIFGTTGTLGRTGLQVLDPAIRALRGRDAPQPDPKGGAVSRIPVLQRLVANPSRRSQAREDFFEVLSGLEQKMNTLTSPQFQGDRKAFLAESRRDLKDAKMFRAVAGRIFKVLKRQREIRAARNLSGSTKRQELDRLDRQINQLAELALRARQRRTEQGGAQ